MATYLLAGAGAKGARKAELLRGLRAAVGERAAEDAPKDLVDRLVREFGAARPGSAWALKAGDGGGDDAA